MLFAPDQQGSFEPSRRMVAILIDGLRFAAAGGNG